MGLGLQAAIHLIYPSQCLTCDARVTTDFGLCGDCWRETPFLSGLICDKCGTQLQGDDTGVPAFCDDCLMIARPWERGRAALIYKDNARALVLALKHGDRMDLARPAAAWLARAGADIIRRDMLLAPIPLHWMRLLKRRYNQAALLSGRLAKLAHLEHCPDLLLRRRATQAQTGGRDARFANLVAAIAVNPRHSAQMTGRHILLIDDVMTSGATFAAAADACLAAGAAQVSTLVLARVVKDA